MKKHANFTYTVSEPDGRSESPLRLDEMKRRIAAGQVTGATLVKRSDADHWSTAAEFSELGVKDVVVSRYDNEVDPLVKASEEARYSRVVHGGAGWFFWIAAMSLVNSFVAFVGIQWGFALGLSIVYPIGEAGAKFGAAGVSLALLLNLSLALLYIFFGVAGWKRQFAPYLAGMSLYAGDAVLALLACDWISAAIHALALAFMYQGLAAQMKRESLKWSGKLVLPCAACALLVAGGGVGLSATLGAKEPVPAPEARLGQTPAD